MCAGWAEINNRISINAAAGGIPVSAAFELTSRCNFNCKMCYVCHSPGNKAAIATELDAGEWIRIGEQSRDAGLFLLTLTGGEVFLRNDFQEIYEAYSRMGFNMTIYSNASLITAEKAKWLGRIPPSKVCVSIYGASPETYEKVTGHGEGYEKTIRGIEALRNENIIVSVRTTVTQDNFREFEQLKALAKSFGSGLGVVNYVSPARPGCGNNPLETRLTPEQTAQYELEIEQQNGEINIQVNPETPEQGPVKADEGRKSSGETVKSAFKCQAGKCGFWINWKGYLTPCGLLDIPCERIGEGGFTAAWERLKKDCMEVPACKECQQCDIREYCMSCPARLMTETGAFDKPAAYLCDTAGNRLRLKTGLVRQ